MALETLARRKEVKPLRLIAAVVALLTFPFARHTEAGNPMPTKELAEFLGPVSPKAILWTKSTGADFDAYVGRAMPPLAGTVNLYIGGWPHFKPNTAGTAITGRVGLFPVTWHRKVASDGTINQETVFQLYGLWKVDIWLEARRQSDIDGMIAVLTRMPTFTEKPKSVR